MKSAQRSSRPYRMGARAESTAATRERILQAATDLFWESPTAEIPLDAVAARAGVSVQTVLRRFHSKAGLLAAAAERETARVRHQRDTAAPGDVAGAARVLVEHYEQMGDRVVRLLAVEGRDPRLKELADVGRRHHREWCERVFARALDRAPRADRRRRLAQLIAVCDVHTWRLLRGEGRLGRRQTEVALTELLEPLAGGA